MSSLSDFFQYIIDFISNLTEFFTSGFVYFLAKLTVWYWELKLSVLKMVYEIASSIIADANISSYLSSAFSNSELMQLAASCRIPEAINIVLSAMLTKFCLRIIGW